jgi:cysteinyl-tRNA synthetase
MQVSNSLTNNREKLEKNTLTWYTCGPTVYDESHIGHARTYMMVDLMKRTLNYFGYKINFGMNITDIDDKIINKAKEEKTDPKTISTKYTDSFIRDMINLNVELPDKIMNVTDYIPEMIKDIEKMVEQELAYIKDGNVYFNKKNYLEKGFKMPEMKHVYDVDETDDNGDFALWKSRVKGEQFGWESPFGFGVISWHIECSTLSHLMFSDGIDIHSGGIDLAFPHHENEIIQNNCIHNDPQSKFIKMFIHIGHLHIEGRKMAKSLKNFITIKDILKKYSPDTIRFYFMLHQYNSNLDFTDSGIIYADNIMKYIFNFINNYTNKEDVITINRFDESIDYKEIISKCEEDLLNNFDFPNFVKYINDNINGIYSSKLKIDYHNIIKFIENIKKIFITLGFSVSVTNDSSKIIKEIVDFRYIYKKILVEKITLPELKNKLFEAGDKFRENLTNMDIKIQDKSTK